MKRSVREKLILIWYGIWAKAFTLLIRKCFFAIGIKTTVIPPLRFRNLRYVQLGERVTIHRNCWIQVISDESERDFPKLIIGDFTSIGMDASITVAKRVVIEDHVILGRNVYISDHNHEFNDTTMPIRMQGIRDVSDVRIGKNSWLGQNSVILPGVTVGRNCIIGANSVVAHNIPDYSVAVGVPAKVVKMFNHETGIWERIGSDE